MSQQGPKNAKDTFPSGMYHIVSLIQMFNDKEPETTPLSITYLPSKAPSTSSTPSFSSFPSSCQPSKTSTSKPKL